MILQALYDYYQRKMADPESNIAPEGWEWRGIPFTVLIDLRGHFIQFRDTREVNGNKYNAKSFLVPSLGEKKGNGIKANLFWENIEYFFGIPLKESRESKYLERICSQHKEFIEKIISLENILDHPAYKAVKFFFNLSDSLEKIKQDQLWEEVFESNSNVIFEIETYGIITDIKEIREVINKREKEGQFGFCLVSGKNDFIKRLHPAIKGVKYAKIAETSLVSVNNEIKNGNNTGQTPAFASYMKEKCYNSPVSENSAFAYSTALKH